MPLIRSVYFFFFQAEDGIRDVAVTGVQTCALPISIGARPAAFNTVRYSEKILESTGISVDRKSTRLNSSHGYISYAVFCLKKKKKGNFERPVARPANVLS